MYLKHLHTKCLYESVSFQWEIILYLKSSIPINHSYLNKKLSSIGNNTNKRFIIDEYYYLYCFCINTFTLISHLTISFYSSPLHSKEICPYSRQLYSHNHRKNRRKQLLLFLLIRIWISTKTKGKENIKKKKRTKASERWTIFFLYSWLTTFVHFIREKGKRLTLFSLLAKVSDNSWEIFTVTDVHRINSN